MQESDALRAYALMLKSRLFEESVKILWEEGKIYGEMHMGVGEEAIIACIIAQIKEGDALALDHRGTPPLVMRGIDLKSLMLEFLGHPEGLCAGQGGHMHLFSKDHLAASSGIVGASGPAAVGFAFAQKYKKTDNIAVAFFGEGSFNQGMMLESFNLASAWKLPVLFVCKDNDWAITTRSGEVTGGNLVERAKGFGIEGIEIDGLDAEAVWAVAHDKIQSMRKDSKPFFIHARCVHRDGHFLGDPLLRFHQTPIKAFGEVTGPLLKSVVNPKGSSIGKRTGSLGKVFATIIQSGSPMKKGEDPLIIIKKKLKKMKVPLEDIEESISNEVQRAVQDALSVYEGGIEQ